MRRGGLCICRGNAGVIPLRIPKTKIIKLKGKALKKLNDRIFEREGDCCALCGAPVEMGIKAHHEPQGALKSDEEQKMLLLCMRCHYNRHHTDECEELKEKCKEYLVIINK